MIWFAGTIAALALLLAAGLRVPAPPAGARRVALRLLLTAGALGATLAANVALYKHDAHFDLTREQAFTPAPETLRVVRGLAQDVELTYFYQKQNPAGRAAKTMVELLGKLNPRLRVQTVDPDQNPALANRLGVRIYNAALLRAGDERIEVVTTDDREIALGILRLLRSDRRPICFSAGQGEYDIDNFEFHTHFEGRHAHSHDAQGMAVVQMEQHGLGRLRRALEKLGHSVRKVTLPAERAVPEECAAFVVANPRTRHGPPEVEALGAYLARGGNLLLLVEPDFPADGVLAALLARAGVRIGEGVIADPKSHYFTDEQMVAVTRYANHPATLGLALSFFPGARPLQPVTAPGVQSTALFSSSAESRVIRNRESSPTGAQAIAVAAEGRLDGRADARPFRLAVVGDADFASNSFFPYLSNADLLLGMLAWLRGEERGPAMKPPVEVLPMVALTNAQMQAVFLISVLLLPGLVALAGGVVWWMRRY
jgi:ABC-type uncharacterized transport system involved in gliding motility auxiliary subunit